MTNAERIRQMTDEKLAQWLTNIEVAVLEKNPGITREQMFADWLDWLKKEVEE